MFVKVKVFPDSKKDEIIKKADDRFESKVKEKAKSGLANKKVIEILSKYLNVPEEKLILVHGAKQRNKIFEIHK
jgi:uncharacterized protein YggU (UPF0235/DUF167 family)